MKENELNYYEKIGNWEFSHIKRKTEYLTNWNYYEKIRENVNEKSLCLDIGTGGGENVLKKYPQVSMTIATDFSPEMIKTAKKNAKEYPQRNVKFAQMDSLNMTFPDGLFDLVSARHTVIDAKQIYRVLSDEGVLVIEGVDQKDCWSLKETFKRGQAYHDKKAISQIDYEDIQNAGFRSIEKVEIRVNEYYETVDDLVALLVKTPILDDFSEEDNSNFSHSSKIEKDLLDEYVRKNTTEKGILLERVLYGIVAKK